MSKQSKQVVHFSSARQSWETPDTLFSKINQEFDFGLDVCASQDNTKCARYLSSFCDGLDHTWYSPEGSHNETTGDYEGYGVHLLVRPVCWMNPPYGKELPKWVEKAASESALGAIVVALLPARTDTRWWKDYVLPYATKIVFLTGRVKFVGAPSAIFPSAVVVFKKDYGPSSEVTWWDWKDKPWGDWE